MGDAHGRAPVSVSGSDTIEPISRRADIKRRGSEPVEAGDQVRRCRRRSRARRSRQALPCAARPAQTASRRRTAGRRQRGCFCLGSGPAIRLSTRLIAASSAGTSARRLKRRFRGGGRIARWSFHSSLSIISPSARRKFCLPRTSKVSTADTDVSRISATSALLMPSL